MPREQGRKSPPYTQPDMKQGYDIILVARARAVNGPYPKLTAAFYKACGQLGLAVGDKT